MLHTYVRFFKPQLQMLSKKLNGICIRRTLANAK